MLRNQAGRRPERGQMVVLFALTLTVVVLGVGLVIDGGNALVQRRGSQNASDFGALAGARIIAEWIGGDTTNGTDANVKAAIANAVTTNGGAAITFGSPNGPVYVNQGGAIVPSAGVAASFVGNGTIPTGAAGVQVSSGRTWRPFFLGIIGVNNWTAAASATAKGGFSAGGPGTNGCRLFPVGIAKGFFDTHISF